MNKRIITTIVTLAIIFTTIFNNSINTNAAANGTWKQSNGRWWYEYADGSYAHNEYIDGYWLDASGWYDSAWNGSWKSDSKGWWFQSGNWYPSNKWLKIDGQWYYFKSNGYMACNEWIGNYYLTNSGTLATNTWIGDYYVGSDGAWVPGKTKTTTTQKSNTTNTSQNNKNTTQTTNNNNTNTTTNNTAAHTHKWVTETTYTIFWPNAIYKSEAIPKAGYGEEGFEIVTDGWYNYNTVECAECHTVYNSYEEYRANDKCAIKEVDENLYKYACEHPSIQYIEERYIKCKCDNLFRTLDEWKNRTCDDHCGYGFRNGGPDYSYNPQKIYRYAEVISTKTTTTCSECGVSK